MASFLMATFLSITWLLRTLFDPHSPSRRPGLGLKENSRGRTKDDVSEIRHIYLDLDRDGEGALERLMKREDLPKPNYVLHTSPGKYQVVWKVEGFTQEQAEVLQRGLVPQTGADPAATDSSRVLRVPGFENHKYEQPHLVQVEKLSQQIHRPEHFPQFHDAERVQHPVTTLDDTTTPRTRRTGTRITQSERDWAYAKRALSRGESKEAVIEAIASYRRFDKRRPRYYAALTVEKASQSTR
jgi:RepB DNA-primase N-terminal domain